jgi:hypothetical protein
LKTTRKLRRRRANTHQPLIFLVSCQLVPVVFVFTLNFLVVAGAPRQRARAANATRVLSDQSMLAPLTAALQQANVNVPAQELAGTAPRNMFFGGKKEEEKK